MMAFFMVMWILGMDQNAEESIEGYFSNPDRLQEGLLAGKTPLSSGNSPATVQTTPLKLISRRSEEEELDDDRRHASSRGSRKRASRRSATASRSSRRTTGLRIELAEGRERPRVLRDGVGEHDADDEADARDHRAGARAAAQSARSSRGTPTPRSTPASTRNWELSADRANAARRVLEGAGLNPARVVEVRGMADRELRNPDESARPAQPAHHDLPAVHDTADPRFGAATP